MSRLWLLAIPALLLCSCDPRPPLSTLLVVMDSGDSVYVEAQYMNTDNQTVRFFIDHPYTGDRATWQVFAAPMRSVRFVHETRIHRVKP